MKINPKEDLRIEESLRGKVASKLPVYTLRLLNWIPLMSLREKKCSLVIYLIFTAIIHLSGISFIGLNIYGIVSTKYSRIVPLPLKYVLLVNAVYNLINAGLFVYRSFFTNDTRNILNFIDERISNMWSTTHKSFMTCLFCFCLMLSVARQQAYYNNLCKDYFRKIATYHYIKNKTLIDVLFTGYYLYTAYLMTFQHLFPLFITYLSICFRSNINSLQQYLNEIKNDAVSSREQFRIFTEKLNEAIDFVKAMDVAFRNNIGFFIIISISDFINWLYTLIVFNKCYPEDKVTITTEMLGFLILFVMASSIHSKVTHTYSNLQSNLKTTNILIWTYSMKSYFLSLQYNFFIK